MVYLEKSKGLTTGFRVGNLASYSVGKWLWYGNKSVPKCGGCKGIMF